MKFDCKHMDIYYYVIQILTGQKIFNIYARRIEKIQMDAPWYLHCYQVDIQEYASLHSERWKNKRETTRSRNGQTRNNNCLWEHCAKHHTEPSSVLRNWLEKANGEGNITSPNSWSSKIRGNYGLLRSWK